MKGIVDFVHEHLKWKNVDADLNRNARRYLRPPKENDEWTNRVVKALEDAFSDRYRVVQGSIGTVWFYKKGSRNDSMKNLICAVSDNKGGDFNANNHLEATLGKEIVDVINSVEG